MVGAFSSPPAADADSRDRLKAAARLRDRALAHLRAKRFDKAAGLLEQALGLYPAFPEAMVHLANIRRDQAQMETALARYRHALEIEPEYPWAHLELAVCLQRLRRFDEALAHYRSAVAHNPKLYKAALFSMINQPAGRFWYDYRELQRLLKESA